MTLVVWDGSDARPFVPGMNLNDARAANTCHYWMPCGQDFPVEEGTFAGEETPGSEPRFRCC